MNFPFTVLRLLDLFLIMYDVFCIAHYENGTGTCVAFSRQTGISSRGTHLNRQVLVTYPHPPSSDHYGLVIITFFAVINSQRAQKIDQPLNAFD